MSDWKPVKPRSRKAISHRCDVCRVSANDTARVTVMLRLCQEDARKLAA